MVLKYNTIKILLTVFLFTVGISLIPLPSQAGNLQYNTEVGIPGARDTVTFTGDTSAIGNYIKAIYSYGIGIVGILAAVVLMVGGVIWLTAGGNVNKVETAKQTIGGALTGLVLALTSYMLLYQINPDLVQFRVREIDTITSTTTPEWQKEQCLTNGTKCARSTKNNPDDLPLCADCCNGLHMPPETSISEGVCGPASPDQTPASLGCCIYGQANECSDGITKEKCDEENGTFKAGDDLKCEDTTWMGTNYQCVEE